MIDFSAFRIFSSLKNSALVVVPESVRSIFIVLWIESAVNLL